MKKTWILAMITLAAFGCSKRSTTRLPSDPDRITFSATVDNLIEIAPKATSPVPQATKLGVYAFQGETLPADNNNHAADNALWSDASNIPYGWHSNFFVQSSGNALYWEQAVPLSFASYYPYQSTGITDYKLSVDMTDQSAAPDYGFAWAKLENASAPAASNSAAALSFNYKVAKITLAIVGDGTTIGTNGLDVSDFESIRIYTTSPTGLYKTYDLDLLSGSTSGEGNLTANDPLKLEGVGQPGGSGQPSPQSWVKAVAYLAPSVDAGLKSEGIKVEIVYNDEGIKRTFISPIKDGSGSLSGDASLKNGIQAGNNYQYTLTLSKNQIMYSGVVGDWNDTQGGEPATGLSADKNNSAIVRPNGGSVTFDIRKCLNNGFTTEADLNSMMGASSTLTADVLWQDGNVINSSDVILDAVHGLLSVKSTKAVSGNAVVALYPDDSKNQGEILWSWHVWVTDYDPDAIVSANAITAENTAYTAAGVSGKVHTYGDKYWQVNAGKAIMDRNLGATRTYYSAPPAANTDAEKDAAATCFGMFYQWGRKDPFPPALGSSVQPVSARTAVTIPIYGPDGTNILPENGTGYKRLALATVISGANNTQAYAVKNPLSFIYNSNVPFDWYAEISANQDNTLWGDKIQKSVYDPCPDGWRIGQNGTWDDFTRDNEPLNGTFPYYSAGVAYESYEPSRFNATNGRLYKVSTSGNGSPLAWYPSSGFRHSDNGILYSVCSEGYSYSWSPAVTGYGNVSSELQFGMTSVSPNRTHARADGYPVRCVQE